MVVLLGPLVDVLEDVIEAAWLLVRPQQECGLGLQSDSGDDPVRAEPDPGSVEQVRVVTGGHLGHGAVGEHQLEPEHLRGQGPRAAAGPVGARLQCAGEGLGADAAQVRQRQPTGGELLAQRRQVDAGLRRDDPGRRVRGPDGSEALGAQLHTRRDRRRR